MVSNIPTVGGREVTARNNGGNKYKMLQIKIKKEKEKIVLMLSSAAGKF